jgi:hypothetical protein
MPISDAAAAITVRIEHMRTAYFVLFAMVYSGKMVLIKSAYLFLVLLSMEFCA